MRKLLFFIAMFLSATFLYADKDIKFFIDNGEVKCLALSRIDSVLFDESDNLVWVILDNRRESFSLSSLDSIKYGILPTELSVTYLGDRAVVENPYAFDSVAVDIDKAKVVVRSSTSREVDYSIQGKSDDGCFKIYGSKKYNLFLNGVELTNAAGAPINSQCKKRGCIFIVDGTKNVINDAASYNSVSGEDEKATIFSEGQIIFEGNGELVVNGNNKHAVCSDDYIEVRGGNIIVESAVSDGFHANDSVIVNGGTLSLSVARDGIDCDGFVKMSGGRVRVTAPGKDAKGIKAGVDVVLAGADVDIIVAGDASKGIKSGKSVNVTAGAISVNATGNTILVDNNPSYATCVKCDSLFEMSGGTMELIATGTAGRGISSDIDVAIVGGEISISCSGNSETYDPALENEENTPEEEKKSYVVYVSVPTSSNNRPGVQSSAWGKVYLYDNSGTLVATLSNKVTVNNTQFYYYDFGTEVTGTYFFKSDNYTSGRTTYTIQSTTFTGLSSDTYYQMLSSYSTSGTVRTYTLNNVTSSYEGGSVSLGSSTEDSYKAVGIKCDNKVLLSGGNHTINVSGTESKGIKAEKEILVSGGNLAITTSGTAKIVANDPSYCTAIKCDGTLLISGGEIGITATGQGGMGISADGELTMNGGTMNIEISGAGAQYTSASGTDYYSTKCLKGDVAVNLLAGTLNCTANGNGSKGIVAGGLLTIGNSGADNALLSISAVTKGSSLGSSSGGGGGFGGGMNSGFNAAPKAIKGSSNVVINSGNIYAGTSYDGGEGIESKAVMTVNGGSIECSTYDDGINAKSELVINGGYIYSHASNNDGIDSNGTITVNGGIALSSGSSAPEEGFDCDQNRFVINGGVMVGTGGATSNPTSATQPYASVSSVSVSQGKYLTVKKSTGEVLFSYKCPNSVNSATVLLTSPDFVSSSSHTLMYGVTSVSGATDTYFDGVFLLGGSVTGGSSKSFTPQTK